MSTDTELRKWAARRTLSAWAKESQSISFKLIGVACLGLAIAGGYGGYSVAAMAWMCALRVHYVRYERGRIAQTLLHADPSLAQLDE